MLFFNEPHFSWRKSLDFVETIQYGGKMFFFFLLILIYGNISLFYWKSCLFSWRQTPQSYYVYSEFKKAYIFFLSFLILILFAFLWMKYWLVNMPDLHIVKTFANWD